MATRKAKNQNKFETVINKTKDIALKVNDFTYNTTEEIIEQSVKRGEQWQNLTSKAIADSLEIMAVNQNIMFDTLDNLKSQFQTGTKRIKSLFSKN